MSRLTIILVVGVLLLSSMVAVADVPVWADYWWIWQFRDGSPVWFWTRPGYGHPGQLVPQWETDQKGLPTRRLEVPNVAQPNLIKYVWFEVKWGSKVPGDDIIKKLTLELPQGYNVRKSEFWKSQLGGGRIWTWKWTVYPQPEKEWICFTDQATFDIFYWGKYNNQWIDEIEVGSKCIPESTTVMLGVLGLTSVAAFRRLRFK
ncbi:MAG: hypothetical protein N3B12_00770 [Armatimonadetes bacterium]|nr:hypothetical protein [Armatimonadota bacterium]